MSEKINKSFLTEEAKNDINEMLDNNSGGGGSSFTTQIETSEGLTLGKGTDNEESLTANELDEIKNPSQLETSGGITLGKGTVGEESLTAEELKAIKLGQSFVYAKGGGQVGSTVSALSKGDAIDIYHEIKINNLTPNKKYAVVNVLSVNITSDYRFIETTLLNPSDTFIFVANDSGEITTSLYFHAIALASLNQNTIIAGSYYITLIEITDSITTNITIN